MKSLIRMSALVALLLFATLYTNAQEGAKFGYLNSTALLAELPAVQQANANLEALKKQLQKKGQQMVETLQKEYTAVAKLEQQGEISPKELEVEAKRLKEDEAKIAKFEQEMIAQLQEKEKTELQPILDKVNNAITSVAEENGFVYIFDSSMGILLYADQSQDVSALVKTKLGI